MGDDGPREPNVAWDEYMLAERRRSSVREEDAATVETHVYRWQRIRQRRSELVDVSDAAVEELAYDENAMPGLQVHEPPP